MIDVNLTEVRSTLIVLVAAHL